MNICLYGAASDAIHPEYLRGAEAFGRALGRRGHTLVFGGGATGMMGAAARGAKAAGGRLVGVAPWFFRESEGALLEGCDEFLHTDTMRERKQLLEERAEGFAVLPGGIGTFDEFFEILTLRQLGRHQKPIALLNLRGYFDPLLTLLERAAEQGFLPAENRALWAAFDRPEPLLDELERQWALLNGKDR